MGEVKLSITDGSSNHPTGPLDDASRLHLPLYVPSQWSGKRQVVVGARAPASRWS